MKYRIVEDQFLGFEVQSKRKWFPIWMQIGKDFPFGTNTHLSVEKAIWWLKHRKDKKVVFKRKVVKEWEE